MTNNNPFIVGIGINPWSMFDARREAELMLTAGLLGHCPSGWATARNYNLRRRELEGDDSRAIFEAVASSWAKPPSVIAHKAAARLAFYGAWTDELYKPETLASGVWNRPKLARMFLSSASDIEDLGQWRVDVYYDAIGELVEGGIVLLRAVARDVTNIDNALKFARDTAARWHADPSRWPIHEEAA